MKKKKIFYIEYWDKKEIVRATFIKATTPYEAEKKFYKIYPYYLVRKVSLL